MSRWLLIILLWTGGDLADGPLARANRYMEDEAWEAAVAAYEDALDRYPAEEAAISLNLGAALARIDSIQSASDRFRLAAHSPALDPGRRSRAANNLGVLTFRLSQPVQALEAFKEALRLDPENEAARYNFELLANLIPPVLPTLAPPAPDLPESPATDQKAGREKAVGQDDEYIQGIKERLRRWRRFVGIADVSSDLFPNEQISIEQAERILNEMRDNEIRFLQQLRKTPVVANPSKERPSW